MKLKNVKTVTIKTDEENPIPIELIAENIKLVGENMSKVLKSGLTLKAICILINANLPSNNKIGLKDIELILSTTSKLDVYIDKDVVLMKEKQNKPVQDVEVHTGTIDEMIKAMMIQALSKYKTHEEAANVLGINTRTFYRYKKDFGIKIVKTGSADR
jgi:transcriptional regulator with PAS, ATPase and Fis domain